MLACHALTCRQSTGVRVHVQFINAAVRMSSGSLGIGGLGTFSSEQLPESMGLGPSSSALNIAALNPADSGRLPDLSPQNPAGSGRYAQTEGAMMKTHQEIEH